MAHALLLSGRVQGVGCRHYCSQTARRMMLRGSATNMPDGTVKVVLDTDDGSAVQRYADALKNNSFRMIFFGRIIGIQFLDHKGPASGDYNF